MEYVAYLHKDKGSDFGVSFPNFPGCVTAGRTLEEARRLADDPAMQGTVAFLVSAGDDAVGVYGAVVGASCRRKRTKVHCKSALRVRWIGWQNAGPFAPGGPGMYAGA